METKRKVINRFRKGDGIRKISRDLNLARNTVRDIIRANKSEGKIIASSYERSVQKYPSLGDYIQNLEKLLRENKNARPKLNIKQIFEELCLQGFKGSYSAVNRYASKWRRLNDVVNPVACILLSFAPSEAYQFDWSSEEIMIDDEIISVKVAHFVLCYSRKKFIYIYPNETHEMVFDAHIRAFNFFGGTPVRGIYDNMKTAVKRVLKGKDREWNSRFEHLCTHYMVEPTACSPARGNEKGRVERQVAIDRSNFFTPMPKTNSLSELNNKLMSQLIDYNNTHKHPKFKDKTINKIFEDEKHLLMSVPVPFDGCKETNVKVTNTCLVQYDRNHYSVDCSCAGQIIQCKSYADKIVFISDGKEVGNHARRFTRGQTYYNYQHYLSILARKLGALRNGAPFIDMELPDDLNHVRQTLEQSPTGSRDFAHILSYIPTQGMESVIQACSYATQIKAISKDVILNALFRNNDEPDEELPKIEEKYLKLKYTSQANCISYNNLLSEVSL